jgi:hypothetical protein
MLSRWDGTGCTTPKIPMRPKLDEFGHDGLSWEGEKQDLTAFEICDFSGSTLGHHAPGEGIQIKELFEEKSLQSILE